MKKETGEHKKHSRILGGIALLSAYCAALVCSHGITSVIYRFIGQPSELLRHLLTGIIAVALIMVVWRLILQFGGGHHREEYHRGIHNQLTDTLARIAQGDFNVLLDPDSIGMYNDLAEAINNMAQNLGTLETMRQDFISNVSHEIQSPLTSIGGFAALLKQDDLPMDERKRYAVIIEAESRRLSSLSDNLLKLSALDNKPLAKTEYRLDKQLSNVILTLEPQWSAKNLNVEADLRKCAICGDEDLLSQVWVNLLVNAIKFTPDGGNICITLNQNTVKIADTGVGIGEEDLPHIFERFYKVDKSRDRSLGGNGLGLSLAKRIVELHNGTIAAQSEPGKGTAFTISLPQKAD